MLILKNKIASRYTIKLQHSFYFIYLHTEFELLSFEMKRSIHEPQQWVKLGFVLKNKFQNNAILF